MESPSIAKQDGLVLNPPNAVRELVRHLGSMHGYIRGILARLPSGPPSNSPPGGASVLPVLCLSLPYGMASNKKDMKIPTQHQTQNPAS